MPPPSLDQLPPADRSGWPWTAAPPPLPSTMPDGRPWPRITVITPSYDQGPFLEETLRSVLLQGYPDLEYVVVDGGSTDESVEILRAYSPWITRWVSEPDLGQSDAIRKALSWCTGSLVNWINSDDVLASGALRIVAELAAGYDAVAGGCENFSDAERTTLVNRHLTPEGLLQRGRPATVFQQPSLWLRPEGIEACGGLDTTMHYAFDWDLAVRYLALFPRVRYTDAVLAHFRLHDASKTVSANARFDEDHRTVYRRLATDARFPGLQRTARAEGRRYDWHRFLDDVMADRMRSPWARRGALLRGIAADPVHRLNRRSLGALRRIS